MDKWLKSSDPVAAQVRAKVEDKLWQEMGKLERISTLARRLHDERKHFARHGLSLALHVDVGYPALFLVSKERKASCKVWWCVSHYRLDGFRYSRRGNLVGDYALDLTSDVDLAARTLVKRLAEDRVWLGPGYLPADLIYLDEMNQASLETLVPPVAKRQIEHRPAVTNKQPVKPERVERAKRRSWWRALFD